MIKIAVFKFSLSRNYRRSASNSIEKEREFGR